MLNYKNVIKTRMEFHSKRAKKVVSKFTSKIRKSKKQRIAKKICENNAKCGIVIDLNVNLKCKK